MFYRNDSAGKNQFDEKILRKELSRKRTAYYKLLADCLQKRGVICVIKRGNYTEITTQSETLAYDRNLTIEGQLYQLDAIIQHLQLY